MMVQNKRFFMDMHKVVASCLIFASLSLRSVDAIDSLGRNQLITYVIAQEKCIKDCKKQFNDIFIECFGTEIKQESSDYAQVGDFLVLSDRDTNKTLVRTTSYTAEYLNNAKEKLELVVQQTVKTIDTMIETGVSTSHKDQFGKTAADYSYTQEVYQALRKHNVPCSLQTWVYFNRIYVVYACVGTVAFVSATKHACWYKDFEKYINTISKSDSLSLVHGVTNF